MAAVHFRGSSHVVTWGWNGHGASLLALSHAAHNRSPPAHHQDSLDSATRRRMQVAPSLFIEPEPACPSRPCRPFVIFNLYSRISVTSYALLTLPAPQFQKISTCLRGRKSQPWRADCALPPKTFSAALPPALFSPFHTALFRSFSMHSVVVSRSGLAYGFGCAKGGMLGQHTSNWYVSAHTHRVCVFHAMSPLSLPVQHRAHGHQRALGPRQPAPPLPPSNSCRFCVSCNERDLTFPPPPPPASTCIRLLRVPANGRELRQRRGGTVDHAAAQRVQRSHTRWVRAPCRPSCAATRVRLGCWPPNGARPRRISFFGFARVILARARRLAVLLAAEALLQQLDRAPAGVLRSVLDASQRARAQLQRFCCAAARRGRERGGVCVGGRRVVAAVGRFSPCQAALAHLVV